MIYLTRPVIWLLCALALEWCGGGVFAEDRPDPAEIVAAGHATAERLLRDYAAWTCIMEHPKGSVRVDVVSAPLMRKYTLWLELNGIRRQTLRIIDRDGLWYIEEVGRRTKYQAFAAPLSLPSYYQYLSRSELLVADHPLLEGEFGGLQNQQATYYSALDAVLQEQLRGVLKSGRELEANHPEQLDDAVKRLLRDVAEVLKKGTRCVLNVETGVAEEYGVVGNRTWIKNFRWLEDADASLFAVDDKEWIDRSANLVEECESPGDLFVIANCPFWRPGSDTRDLERLVVDLKSREQRRIPYALGQMLDACLSRDRRRAYVVGVLLQEATIGLFEIDLGNGFHRRLGALELQYGEKVFGGVSPDGRTLAVLQMDHTAGPLHCRVHMVDVASGESKSIGPAVDMAYLSWLPEGDGLIVMTRERDDELEQETSTICRMDLDGTLTPIRPGHGPVVVPSESRILFEERETDHWHSCNLEGEDVRIVGDGLKGFGFASVSPDGKQLMMMKFGGPKGPVPHIVELATGKSTPLPLGPGLWALPHWQ